MDFVQYGLESNGYEVTCSDSEIIYDAINIVFGAFGQLTTWTELTQQSPYIIVYNWEPASPLIGRFSQCCIRTMQNAHVWDYSEKNVFELKALAGVQDIHYLPMCYAPSMTRISAEVEDIDVLFYGDIQPRRRNVINALRQKGLNVVTSEDVGEIRGAARDALIQRAKVLLNIHAFDFTHRFEIARVSYWLANSKAVVTEVSDETDIDESLKVGMACGRIDELAQLCYDLVCDKSRRNALARKSFEVFSAKNSTVIMKEAVDRYLMQRAAGTIGNHNEAVAPTPKTAQIGSGSTSFILGAQWCYSHCNIDARADFSPDVVLDMGKPLPLDKPLLSWRLGKVALHASMFQRIISHDFFQRVPDFKQALSNCLILLEDNGTLEVSVPLDARMHADDMRCFNELTWGKILENWWQYDWQTHRFEIVSVAYSIQRHNAYAYGFLSQHNNDWSTGMRSARVIDMQQLVLRKRALTSDEIKQLPQTRFMD